jgi:ABC-type uncharacterized transport system permease subunit
MNTGNLLSLSAAAFYLVSIILIIIRLRSQLGNNQETPEKSSRLYQLFWPIALILHIVALHYPLMIGKALHLNLMTAGSYVMWLISLILFISTLKRKVEVLAIFILPFAILSLLATMLFSPDINPIVNMKSGLGVHILFSLLAYSLLMLASFQALLLAYQNNQLHTHQHSPLMRALPSLEDMEHLLFRLIGVGVIMLSIGLLSGFYYLDNLFGARIAHKTILSIIAWVIFSVLLFGRWKYGWRGRKAVRWTLAGFIILMLAFFGTKIVQEYLIETNPATTSLNTRQ